MYFEVFKGVHNHWYWRLIADNNRKIAFCSEGYLTKQDALANISLLKTHCQEALVHELSL